MSAMALIIHQKLKDLLIFEEVNLFFLCFFIYKERLWGPVKVFMITYIKYVSILLFPFILGGQYFYLKLY